MRGRRSAEGDSAGGAWAIGAGAIVAVAVAVTALSGPVPVSRTLSDPTAFPGSVGDRFDALPDRANIVHSLERTAVVGPDRGIAVANLTVEPGRYLVSYEFESRLISQSIDAELTCGIVDNNGVDRFLAEDPDPLAVGAFWERHVVTTQFSLPDVTLGVRCFSERTHLVHARFRDVSLSVVRMAPAD